MKSNYINTIINNILYYRTKTTIHTLKFTDYYRNTYSKHTIYMVLKPFDLIAYQFKCFIHAIFSSS